MQNKIMNDILVPFWFWNGFQKEDEISRQLELAAGAGLHGMAIHARSGNQTEYLSPRWFELVRHACKEAQRLGLKIWLYDEEGYPSGSVGGRLPALGEPYRQKALAYDYCRADEVAKDHLALFALDDLSRQADLSTLAPDTSVLAFYVENSEPIPYIDTLNAAAVEKFIELTHERYYAEAGEFFGNVIPVIYTDDLNHLLDDNSMHHLSWTPGIEEKFLERYGYSLTEKLPLLLEDLPGCEKLRADYRKLVRDLFLDNCIGVMAKWCSAHGVKIVGHLSGDEGPFSNILRQFTDPMLFYERESVPGIDDFMAGMDDGRYLDCPVNKNGKSMIVLVKTVSSVAHQFGDGSCSGEILTSLGWGVPLARQMAQINVNLVLGVNMLTAHAYSYTSGGITKRDHPASFFYQQPYFKFHKEFSAQLIRSVERLRSGKADNDTLVIYPALTVWTISGADSLTHEKIRHFCNPDFPDLDEYYREFAGILLKLSSCHTQFDLGHEEQLAKYGRVENGKLILGNMEYSSVILPALLNIERSTLDILRRFASDGGKVFYEGDLPRLVGGIECADDMSFIAPPDINAVFMPFTAENMDKLMVQRREVEGKKEYFIVNCSGTVQHLSSGRGFAFYSAESDSLCGGSFELLHGCSVFLVPAEYTEVEYPENASGISEIKWKISRDRGNLFLIDFAAMPDGRNFFCGQFPEHEAGTVLHRKFDFPGGSAVLWSENQKLLLNGVPLKFDLGHHPANNALYGADVSGILKPLDNILEIISDGRRVENMYIEGDFLISLSDNDFKIIPDSPLSFGDLALSGMPFYWGTVVYEGEFTAEKAGTAAFSICGNGVMHIEVNGSAVPLIYTPQAVRRVPVKTGRNKIVITLANSAQNFFGHHREFALTADYRGGEGRSRSSWRPPQRGTQPDSVSVAPFGIETIKLENTML